jgi:hypothetical protein
MFLEWPFVSEDLSKLCESMTQLSEFQGFRRRGWKKLWSERIETILEQYVPKAVVVQNAHWHSMALDEFSEKAQFNVVEHDVGGPLILHEELEVGHVLVLELLKPLALHVVLLVMG